MDARMMMIINRLEEHISNLEKAMAHTRGLLKELAKEARKNETQRPQIHSNEAASGTGRGPAKRTFLANQQLCRDGTYPRRAISYRENDDAD